MTTYFPPLTPDELAKLEAVEAAGGRVLQPRTEVGEYGLSMALFSDTEGNVMGVYNYGAAK